MKPKKQKICIEIIYTSKAAKQSKRVMEKHEKTEHIKKKDDDKSRKFVCSMCLNTRPEDQCQSCHLCQRSCPSNHCHICEQRADTESDRPSLSHAKTIQTSDTDLSTLHLLNEVLNVFHTKKSADPKNSKATILKDACVSTDKTNYQQQNLTTSKIFQHSIEGEFSNNPNRNAFVIVNSSQPTQESDPNLVIHLKRPKSCSIPQMKLEELKHSLNDLKMQRSKDAVDEVNRMFANVKKIATDDVDANRPATRHGPRILPVVKTKNCEQKASSEVKKNVNRDCSCCCANYNLSGGDSSKNISKSAEDKIQILCCRHKHCDSRLGADICSCSRKSKKCHESGPGHCDGRS